MQSRLESLLENVLNVGSGFLLAFVIWQFVAAPLWGYDVTLLDNLGLTSIFTVASVARGYLWRRYFNRRALRRFVGREDD